MDTFGIVKDQYSHLVYPNDGKPVKIVTYLFIEVARE